MTTANEQEIVQMTLEGLVPGHFALHLPSGILAHPSAMPEPCPAIGTPLALFEEVL